MSNAAALGRIKAALAVVADELHQVECRITTHYGLHRPLTCVGHARAHLVGAQACLAQAIILGPDPVLEQRAEARQ